MRKANSHDINKLRKVHIWPAVLFLVLSFFLTIIACSFFVAVIFSYFASDRMQTIHDNVKNINSLFSGESEPADPKEILRYLEEDTDYSDAIYLIDQDKNVIGGFGDATYDLNHPVELMIFSEEREFYFDKASDNTIIDAKGDISVENMMKHIARDGIFSLQDLKEKRILLEDFFWTGLPVGENAKLLVRCTITFYTWDLVLALILGLASLAVMFLSLVFLLINVLISASHQRQVTRLLYLDTVTGGQNWLYFDESVKKELGAKKNTGNMYAVVDVAFMKYRNYCTFHGVGAGEEALAKTDEYLASHIKKRKEFCAHNGRASFALFLQCFGQESCTVRVEEMLKEMANIHGHTGIVYHAGIYFIEPSRSADGKRKIKRKEISVSELYNCARAARTSIPEDDPMEAAVFDRALLEESRWVHRVEEKMQKALDNEEFSVYIQPKYDPVTEELVGAEALVRWINEEDGFVSPGKFIPIFEKNGFITKLDDYMISHVAKLQAQWLSEGKKVVPVSVNVSRAHFANANLAKHICRLVDEYKTPHSLIEIELTESAFFDDKAALQNTVRKLQEAGFDVAMDDFRAGYSSLNSLKDLPLNVLKLDADFFRGENGEGRGEIVVAEAIALAKKLHMRIVAEGVEKKEQVEFLAKQDCDMIQGFYFAKPMPASEYQEKL